MGKIISRSIINTKEGYVVISTKHFASSDEYQTMVFISNEEGTILYGEELEEESYNNYFEACEGHIKMIKKWIIPSQESIDRLKKIRYAYCRTYRVYERVFIF